jgi:hypothetical protein
MIDRHLYTLAAIAIHDYVCFYRIICSYGGSLHVGFSSKWLLFESYSWWALSMSPFPYLIWSLFFLLPRHFFIIKYDLFHCSFFYNGFSSPMLYCKILFLYQLFVYWVTQVHHIVFSYQTLHFVLIKEKMFIFLNILKILPYARLPLKKPPVCAPVPSASCLRPCSWKPPPPPPVMGCCSFARRSENRWTNQIILLWPGALCSPLSTQAGDLYAPEQRLEASTPESLSSFHTFYARVWAPFRRAEDLYIWLSSPSSWAGDLYAHSLHRFDTSTRPVLYSLYYFYIGWRVETSTPDSVPSLNRLETSSLHLLLLHMLDISMPDCLFFCTGWRRLRSTLLRFYTGWRPLSPRRSSSSAYARYLYAGLPFVCTGWKSLRLTLFSSTQAGELYTDYLLLLHRLETSTPGPFLFYKGRRPLRLTLFWFIQAGDIYAQPPPSSTQAGDLYARLYSPSTQPGDINAQTPPFSTQTKDFSS